MMLRKILWILWNWKNFGSTCKYSRQNLINWGRFCGL